MYLFKQRRNTIFYSHENQIRNSFFHLHSKQRQNNMNTAPPPYSKKKKKKQKIFVCLHFHSQYFLSYYKIAEKIPFQQAPLVSVVQPVYSAVSPTITGDFPVQCVCPHCRTQVVTRTEKTVGLLSWIICIALFFTLMWVCCFIPFCVDACKVSRIDIVCLSLHLSFFLF
mgnify:FL=1